MIIIITLTLCILITIIILIFFIHIALFKNKFTGIKPENTQYNYKGITIATTSCTRTISYLAATVNPTIPSYHLEILGVGITRGPTIQYYHECHGTIL